MIRKHNSGAVRTFLSAVALAALAACTRPPPGSGSSMPPAPDGGPAATAPAASSRPRAAGPAAEPAVRPVPQDRLVGARPLERRIPEDFDLGPLEDLSSSEGEGASAAARSFLDGLLAGKIEAVVPEARDVIEFITADLLAEGSRPTGWRLGEGIPRPEGGRLFPFALTTPAGRVRGGIYLSDASGTGWRVELVTLDPPGPPEGSRETSGPFDPTIRTVQTTGR